MEHFIKTPVGYFPLDEAADTLLDDTFITGDIVALVSGGPGLTVIDYCEDCGEVEVAWFEGETLRLATFPEETLFLVDDEDDVPYSNASGDTLH